MKRPGYNIFIANYCIVENFGKMAISRDIGRKFNSKR